MIDMCMRHGCSSYVREIDAWSVQGEMLYMLYPEGTGGE